MIELSSGLSHFGHFSLRPQSLFNYLVSEKAVKLTSLIMMEKLND